MSASATLTSSCTATMPEAWCTTYWKSALGHQRGGQLSGRGVRLQHEDCLGGDVGHDQRVRVLFIGERPWSVAVQMECPEAHRSHMERKAEHRPHARVEDRPGKRGPPQVDGFGQIGFQDRAVLVVGVHAGTFPEVVLQLLDERAHRIGGAHRASRHVAGHQHDSGAIHRGDVGAHLAQPLRLQLRSGAAAEPGEYP